MVLIDFLNKTIPGGGAKNSQGGQQFFLRFAQNLPTPWLKSCVRAWAGIYTVGRVFMVGRVFILRRVYTL